MILGALLIWASGAFDRPGFEGVGQGFAFGAACAVPLWLLSLRRRAAARKPPDEAER
ncbi:hypothetical protein JOD31_003763 [Methylopila capsulata]|uniref:Uncharacterized protein n=1 Tax=Methylopila capsulata TaxID=61654 RepID=A0A9W6MTE0_9HYPH|nr:hypothetical protein [Methylopila capsulata]MBM7853502.1 hypothetical protein [Methylopila capsulata]GLK57283.1 hypothetical protein GCM10008170_33030 [Methylopila capsulata]